MKVAELTEGWMAEKAPGTRRYHYIVDTMALCRGLGFYRGRLMEDRGLEAPTRLDCRECHRRLRKRTPATHPPSIRS